MASETPVGKVLLVEDDGSVRAFCALVLRRHGFEPIEARNGAEGLEIYRRAGREIILTISDVTMPRMNGVEMFRSILEIDEHPNLIIMSGYVEEALVPAEVRKLCSVLLKPFTPAQLIESVRRCLEYERHKHDPGAL